MAADLNKLDPTFAAACKKLLDRCSQKGVDMRPNEGVRDIRTQAKYWRQSRSIEQIRGAITMLRQQGADHIADTLDSVGPQHGDPVTNALPGASWHQWGLALDCFWLVNGAAEWSTTKKINGVNGYRLYADEAEALNLTAGGHWSSLKDWPHVQAKGPSSPLGQFTWAQIDAKMRQLYP